MRKEVDKIVDETLAIYATGARAGHRGFFRKSKFGKITHIGEAGKSPEKREKEALERKLKKRRKGKKRATPKKSAEKKKVKGERGEIEEGEITKRRLALLKAFHSLRRKFS